MKKCSCCGKDIPTESKFCPYCRNDLSQETNCCPSCGKELPLESNFCPYCMERINEPLVAVSVPENKQKLNKKAIIVVAIVLLLVLGVAIAIFLSQNDKTGSHGIVDNEDTTESTESAEHLSGESVSENDEIIVDFHEEIYNTDDEQTTDEEVKDVIGKTEPSTNDAIKQDVTQPTQKEEPTTKVDPCAYGHDWIELSTVVYHEEEGHYGMVEKQRPVTMYKCPVCYKKYASLNEYYSHFDSTHKPSYSGDPVGAFRNQYTTVTGYEYYEVEEWIVDREAYEETVVTGYKCKTCGKEKSS